MPDTWISEGVTYTTDAKAGTGGVITAQRANGKRIHSRIVPKPVNREETEKLFETDLAIK